MKHFEKMETVKKPNNKIQTVVISGSTSGLGREMSLEFANRGWQVAGLGKTKSKVEKMAEIMGEDHLILECDVSCNDSVKTSSNHIIERLGAPSILVNNAAVMNTPKPLWNVTASEFDYLTRVNINGVANMIRHFVPDMIQKGKGLIVNLSSGWGRSTSPEVAPYCATKWAIEGLSSAMAQELPKALSCVALNPGVINTEMLQKCWGEAAENYQNPEDWARLAVPFIEKLSSKDNGKQVTAP